MSSTVQVSDNDNTEVMITEVNIILMTVGDLPDDGFLMLTLQCSAGPRISNGFRNDHIRKTGTRLFLIASYLWLSLPFGPTRLNNFLAYIIQCKIIEKTTHKVLKVRKA